MYTVKLRPFAGFQHVGTLNVTVLILGLAGHEPRRGDAGGPPRHERAASVRIAAKVRRQRGGMCPPQRLAGQPQESA